MQDKRRLQVCIDGAKDTQSRLDSMIVTCFVWHLRATDAGSILWRNVHVHRILSERMIRQENERGCAYLKIKHSVLRRPDRKQYIDKSTIVEQVEGGGDVQARNNLHM